MSDYALNSLASHLINDAGILALLNKGYVYLDIAEPGHGPEYITVSAMSLGENVRHQGGSSGKRLQDFQVNAWSETGPLEAAAVANAIRLSLNGLATGGTLGTSPDDMTVTSVFIDDPPDSTHIASRTGGEQGTYGARQTVSIWYGIAKPS